MKFSVGIYLGAITPGNLTDKNSVPYDVDGVKELLKVTDVYGAVTAGFVAERTDLKLSQTEAAERARLATTLLDGALQFIKFNVEGREISYDWEGKPHLNYKITDESWPKFINFYTKPKAGKYTVAVIPQRPGDSLLLSLRILRDGNAAAAVQVELENDDIEDETTG
jgi:hypothetical protein